MDYFLTALAFSGYGVLFGLFPSLLSFSDTVFHAVMVEHKKVPLWMITVFTLASGNPDVHKLDMGFYTPKSAHIVTLVFSSLVVVVGFVLAYFMATNNSGGDTIKFIIIIIVFPIFVLLTWLLPIYFLRRYLRHLKSENPALYPPFKILENEGNKQNTLLNQKRTKNRS